MEDSERITSEIIRDGIVCKEGISAADVKNIKFILAPGSNKGDNFTCTIFAIKVTAEVKGILKNYDFIGKVIPVDQTRSMFVAGSKMFDTEVHFYKTLRTQIDFLSEEFKLPVPKCYYAENSTGVILLENLKTEGYKMSNKMEGLNESHLNLILREMAKFHALCHHFLVENGLQNLREAEIHRPSWFRNTPVNQYFHGFFQKCMVSAQEMLESNGVDVQDMKNFLQNNNITSAIDKRNDFKKSHFKTLLHGDCWSNNFLFKYGSDGQPISLKLVDFQLTRTGAPGVDLAHVLFTGVDPENRSKNLSNWLKTYHDMLMSSLKELGYLSHKIYTPSDLKEDFDKARLFGLFIGCFMAVSTMTSDASEGALDTDKLKGESLEEAFEKTELTDAMKSQKIIGERIQSLVKEGKAFNVFL